jgi:hypothetical protein
MLAIALQLGFLFCFGVFAIITAILVRGGYHALTLFVITLLVGTHEQAPR